MKKSTIIRAYCKSCKKSHYSPNKLTTCPDCGGSVRSDLLQGKAPGCTRCARRKGR